MVLNGFICEGPRCATSNGGRPVLVQWDASQTDPMALPNELFRFIHVRPVYEEPSPENQGQQQPRERHFCSSGCVRDYFNESRYVPPRSPREQAEQDRVNAAASGTVDGFGKPRVLGTAKVIPFPRGSQTAAVAQADGAGDDAS